MREIYNAKAIHSNGSASLQVGIRGDGFLMSKSSGKVTFTNISTNQAIPIQTTFYDSNGISIESRLDTLAGYFSDGVLKVANGGTANSTTDSSPTENSTKMVTSGGVYTALSGKASATDLSTHTGNTDIHVTAEEKAAWNAMSGTMDDYPTENSNNAVKSGGLYTTFAGKVSGISSSTDGGLMAFDGTGGETAKKAASTGSATQGIYLDTNGVPTAMTCTVAKSVPSDAVFTDTVYTHPETLASAMSEDLYTVAINEGGHITAATKKTVDSTPTSNSSNLITSGGVYTALSGKVSGISTSVDGGLMAFSGTGGKTAKKAGTAGSATQGIYLDADGVPTAMTYTVEKSVPSDAVFTDTVYTHPTYTAKTTSSIYKIKVDDTGHVSSATAVTVDTTPTSGHTGNYLVTSDGIYQAIKAVSDRVTELENLLNKTILLAD